MCVVCWLNHGHSGSNVSHIVVLRPLKSGYFNFTSADISYVASEQSEEPQVSSFIHDAVQQNPRLLCLIVDFHTTDRLFEAMVGNFWSRTWWENTHYTLSKTCKKLYLCVCALCNFSFLDGVHKFTGWRRHYELQRLWQEILTSCCKFPLLHMAIIIMFLTSKEICRHFFLQWSVNCIKIHSTQYNCITISLMINHPVIPQLLIGVQYFLSILWKAPGLY